jgi:hypothetical protein
MLRELDTAAFTGGAQPKRRPMASTPQAVSSLVQHRSRIRGAVEQLGALSLAVAAVAHERSIGAWILLVAMSWGT